MKSGRLFDEFEESPNQLGIISEPGKIALMKLQKGFFFASLNLPLPLMVFSSVVWLRPSRISNFRNLTQWGLDLSKPLQN